MLSVVLSAEDIRSLTGYRRAGEQLAELHRLGYWRARRCPITGRVILERAHYEAVASGARAPETAPRLRPAPALR